MKKDPGFIGLISATITVAAICIPALVDHILMDYPMQLSDGFFLGSLICLAIGWIMHLTKSRKK